MRIRDITSYIESLAPLAYQESYDNAGLLIGNQEDEIESALLTLDVTEKVVDEAISGGFGIIIAHHPLIFNSIKKLNRQTETGRCVIKAIQNDIAVYAAHTNLDGVIGGVNSKICEKLGLINCDILSPVKGQLRKLVTFIPRGHAGAVQEAVFKAGAGNIGNYDSCGYTLEGTGSFRGNESSQPFVGEKGHVHFEQEIRFETVFPAILENQVIQALLEVHPYEEVAYDIYSLENEFAHTGAGMTGEVHRPVEEKEFLEQVKTIFDAKVIKHSPLLNRKIKKVAVCGGAGSFLVRQAVNAHADIFLTGDLKYHEYFEAEGKIILADIGHFESEQFTKELFYELLTKKFSKFAVRLSEVNTNPVNYLI
ncbi:MAG: Nif3-like dinuclear metal center hexameric protein [Prolixibacteraceae bacterium]